MEPDPGEPKEPLSPLAIAAIAVLFVIAATVIALRSLSPGRPLTGYDGANLDGANLNRSNLDGAIRDGEHVATDRPRPAASPAVCLSDGLTSVGLHIKATPDWGSIGERAECGHETRSHGYPSLIEIR